MNCDFGDKAGVCADLMRFLVRMRGALTPPPRMDAPVTKIPLEREHPISKHRTRDARRLVAVLAPSCPEDA